MDVNVMDPLSNSCHSPVGDLVRDFGDPPEARQSQSARVAKEEAWRVPRASVSLPIVHADRIEVSRWTQTGVVTGRMISHNDQDRFIIGIQLASTSAEFRNAGRLVVDGRLAPGASHVSRPGEAASVTLRSTCDVIHLYVAHHVLNRYCAELLDGGSLRDDQIPGNIIFYDRTLEHLGRLLASTHDEHEPVNGLYVESLSLAILARLFPLHASKENRTVPRWRLQRAMDYIEANLADPIHLSDIASSVGLTRMHFARQFREATGFTPHSYLRERRLQHAQQLLQKTDMNILDVALNSGFASHAHFATVFKRRTGATPKEWRRRLLFGA
jgi:AraC family transcriptional regulator